MQHNPVKLWTKQFVLIVLLNLFLFFGFQIMMPTFPLFIQSLGANDAMIGLISGAFTLTTLLARPLSGAALDTIGRKQVLFAGIAIFLVATFAYSYLPGLLIVFGFRLLHGFGWGFSGTATSTIAAENIPKPRFAEGMGYFSLSTSISMALAPAIGLFLMAGSDFRTVTFLAGALVIIGLILSFFLCYPKIDKTTKAALKKEKTSLYERQAIRPAGIMFFATLTYGTVISFISLYAAQEGVENIGLYFTVYAVTLLFSRPMFGRLIDKKGYDYALIPGLLFMTLGMFVISVAHTLPVFLLAGFFYGIGFGATHPSLQTMATRSVAQNRLGAANATFFTGFDLGIGVGAIIFGKIASLFGYSIMYQISMFCALLGLVIYLIFVRKHYVGANKDTPEQDLEPPKCTEE